MLPHFTFCYSFFKGEGGAGGGDCSLHGTQKSMFTVASRQSVGGGVDGDNFSASGSLPVLTLGVGEGGVRIRGG